MGLPDLSRYDRVAVDTETTGVDTRARPVGLSISTPDGFRQYVSWGAGDPNGLDGPREMNNVSLGEVRDWARRELRHPHVLYVGHNMPFDLRMLAYVGIHVGPRLADTQIVATLLDEHRISFSLDNLAQELGIGVKTDTELNDYCARQYGGKPTRKDQAKNYWRVPVEVMAPYAENDPVLTLGVFDVLHPQIAAQGLTGVYELETNLLPVLLRMHLHGTRADVPRALALRDELQRESEVLADEWTRTYGGMNFRSADELKPLLDELGIAYPLTPKTQKPSITKTWLDHLDHPIGKLIRRMRQVAHYRDTFVGGYILDNCKDSDILHPEFHALKKDNQGATGGRFSSSGDLNAQNVPARDEEWAPKIRSLFRPMRDSQLWLRLDYSQIEYRFFAHYAGCLAERQGHESAMERAYINDPHIDFHSWVAQVTGIPRKPAKNVNFCKLYGGGIAKIALTAGISIEEATAFVKLYEEKIPEAKALSKDVSNMANVRGWVRTWAGRYCRFMTEGQLATRYGTQVEGSPNAYSKTYAALNRVLQGSAADLIKRSMIEVDKEIDWESTILHLTVHDELDFSVERETAEAERTKIQTIMQDTARTPAFNGKVMKVPVIAEAELGPSWGECE